MPGLPGCSDRSRENPLESQAHHRRDRLPGKVRHYGRKGGRITPNPTGFCANSIQDGDQEYYHSWDDIAALLDGRRGAVQGDLFERPKPIPEWREINVSGIEVKRVRDFGQVWAALAVWRRLALDKLFAGLMPEGREDTGFICF